MKKLLFIIFAIPLFTFAQNDSIKNVDKIKVVDSVEPFLPEKQNYQGIHCASSIRNVGEPAFIVDGKYINAEQAKQIDPNNIKSIRIEKTGKYGTIVIETKEGLTEYDLAVSDLGYESFLAMQPSVNSFSLSYLQNRNRNYVSVWNGRVLSGNPEIYEMPIDYDSQTYYGLDFEYKLYMFFKFMENKYQISMM
jgi:hypothetical protein